MAIWNHLEPHFLNFLKPHFCAGNADGKVPQMEAGFVSNTDVPQEPEAHVFFEQGGECLHGFHEVMPGKYFTYEETSTAILSTLTV